MTEVTANVMAGLITVHAEVEIMKGPGQRFSVEPFMEGTWRVIDYLSRKCVAMCPSPEWATIVAERLNGQMVFIRDDV